jgi:hypothetical protein
MTILEIPVASAMAWLLAFAFAGAGLFNAIGGAAVQAGFIRWGYRCCRSSRYGSWRKWSQMSYGVIPQQKVTCENSIRPSFCSFSRI